MIDLKVIREIALANVEDPDSAYYYRNICRWFAKTFNTPMSEVKAMPPQELYLHYFESAYELMEDDDKFVDIMKAIDPDFEETEEEEIQDFIDMIEQEEEAKRQKKNPPPTQPIVRTFEDDTPE